MTFDLKTLIYNILDLKDEVTWNKNKKMLD